MMEFNVERFVKLGEAEALHVKLIRGLCFNIIDVRSNLVCNLSAEDGEWSSGRELPGLAKQYRALMKRAIRLAEACTDNPEALVFALMTEAAKEQGQSELLPWA